MLWLVTGVGRQCLQEKWYHVVGSLEKMKASKEKQGDFISGFLPKKGK